MKIWKIVLGGTIVGMLSYAFVEPFRYIVKKYEIKHPRIPQDFDGFRIIFLADIHYGRISRSRYLNKVVQRANAYSPDIVILGGDYITHEKYIEPCFEIIQKLESKYGVYGVLGNHDVVENLQKTEMCMKRAGVESINNAAVWLKKTNKIKLGGVGDYWTQSQDIEPTLKDVNKKDYVILVTHNPKYVHQIDDIERIGLILGGHTHGAQFAPLRHVGKITPDKINKKTGLKYLSGKYNSGDTDIIVSNGIGTAKFPFRFFTPPEMVVIELSSKQKACAEE